MQRVAVVGSGPGGLVVSRYLKQEGFEPVIFDGRVVELIEAAARKHGLASRRMTSGAGHDAQMIARIAPAAMIFVPSAGGISHSPSEHTEDAELVAGANILLDVVAELAELEG